MWRYNLRTVEGIALTRDFLHAAAELGIISSDDAGHVNNMLRQIDLSTIPDSSFVTVIDMACEGIEAKVKDALIEAQAHAELSATDEEAALLAFHAAGRGLKEAQEVLMSAKDRVQGLNIILSRE